MNHWPTYVEVNLSNIKHNIMELKRKIGPGVSLMPVIKAEAYGHGACAVAKAAFEAGADQFGVVCVDEAIALRESGISCPILIVSLSFPDTIPDIVKYDIMPTVGDLAWAKELSDEAVRQGKDVRIHVNINTGMNRFGVEPEDALGFISDIRTCPNLIVEGIFTHLATAYVNPEGVARQFSLFKGVLARLEENGIDIPFKHCASSGAVLNHPETYLNMVRPGCLITTPYHTMNPASGLDIRESFELKSKVIFVRQLKAGTPVGYDQLYTCGKDSTLAVVSAGWADGIPRELTNKGYVLIHGKRCPIRGRIMCDQVFADVTEVEGPVVPGDEVVIVGAQGGELISCWEWRDILGGVSSPITLRSNRNPRVSVRYIQP